MTVGVIYASKSGSTQGIAEFIAGTIREQGISAEALNVNTRPDSSDYDAVVIGSAVYMGRWVKEAVAFVQRDRTILAGMPVWLFSSGPLVLDEGVTLDDPSLEPREIAALRDAVHPRDHRVFTGALNPGRCGVALRVMRMLPAARKILPEGDFRDWEAIEAWAKEIARAVEPHEP